MDLENSVRNTKRDFFLNQGAVTVEDHTQLKNNLSNSESIRSIRHDPSTNATIIMSALNVKVGSHILSSDVYHRITSHKIVQNWTIRKQKFTGTQKSLKLVLIFKKMDMTPDRSTYQNESQQIYTSMSHMSSNVYITRRDFGDSSQLTNCILDLDQTCHTTLEISDLILE